MSVELTPATDVAIVKQELTIPDTDGRDAVADLSTRQAVIKTEPGQRRATGLPLSMSTPSLHATT